jgi:hypothetical protein
VPISVSASVIPATTIRPDVQDFLMAPVLHRIHPATSLDGATVNVNNTFRQEAVSVLKSSDVNVRISPG